MDRSIDRPIDRSIHRSIDRPIDRPHRISHRIGDRISPIGDRIASDRTSGIFSRVFLCFFACLRARAVVSCLIHSRASRVDPRSRRRRLRRRQRDLSSSCYIGTYVFCGVASRMIWRGCLRAHSFACARKPFARVTRRANVILNDASAARASAGWARACARVMVWGVVARDRARTGVGARLARAHRVRASWAFGPLSDDADATGDLARRVCASRVACGGGSRARTGGRGWRIYVFTRARRERA